MAEYFNDDKITQISPCIASKAKYALGIKTKIPSNKKNCSVYYWQRTINRIAELNNKNPKVTKVTPRKITEAIAKYHDCIPACKWV